MSGTHAPFPVPPDRKPTEQQPAPTAVGAGCCVLSGFYTGKRAFLAAKREKSRYNEYWKCRFPPSGGFDTGRDKPAKDKDRIVRYGPYFFICRKGCGPGNDRKKLHAQAARRGSGRAMRMKFIPIGTVAGTVSVEPEGGEDLRREGLRCRRQPARSSSPPARRSRWPSWGLSCG